MRDPKISLELNHVIPDLKTHSLGLGISGNKSYLNEMAFLSRVPMDI